MTLVESPLIDTHGPYSVTADANGNISDSSFVTDSHDVGVHFTLTAAGSITQAKTTFTDAVKKYEAIITPTSDTAGDTSASYKVTITNDATSTNNFSSATIAVPSGYTSIALGTVTTSPSGLDWTAAITSGVITLSANGGASQFLNAGQSVSLNLTANAPCPSGSYVWTTATAGNFTLVGSQPAVAVSGTCQTTTTIVSSVNPSVFGQSVSFTATVTSPNQTPTGSVQFKIDGSNFGSPVALSSGTATSSATSSLLAGSHTIEADYLGNSTLNASSNTLSQTVNKVTPTVTWPNPAAITYGTALTGTQLNATFTALVNGSPVAVPGTATYNPAAGTVLSAGTQTLSVSFVPNDTSDYNNAGGSAQLAVNKASLTVTASSPTVTYGDPVPAITAGISGFVNGDNSSVLTTQPTCTTAYTTASNAGSAPATSCSGAVATNYTFMYVAGSVTINKRNVTWITNPNSKTYGDPDPSPLTTGSGTNFVAADGVTATYARVAGETVLGGPYHITATLGPAAVLSNYTITNAGASFTISARNATWTTNASGKTYGDADPSPLTTGSGTNFVAADGVTATYTRVAGETVLGGPYHITATLGPAAVLSNYTITNAGASFTISARNATWTTNASGKTYGDADPSPLTTGSGTNFVTADGVTATYTRVAGETVLGGPYHITATLGPAAVLSNYTITNAGASFTISARNATWTTNASGKTYGDADPSPLTTGSGTNFVAADGVTATYTRVAGETVLGGPYHITATLGPAAVLSNYTITNAGANFTISARNATWTTNASGKTYGDADPSPLTTGSGTNFVAADGVTATYARVAGETVLGGPYHITATLGPAAVLSNYTITNAGASFTINKALLTVTADNKTMILHGALPTFTASFTGFKLTDTLATAVTGSPSLTTTATSASSVGPYTITATLGTLAANNYTFAFVNGTLTIQYATNGICDGDAGHQILQPINLDGSSVFKQGSTTPAKFRVCDASGQSIGIPGVVVPGGFVLYQTLRGTTTNVDEVPDSTTPDTAFRWDPTGQQWIFNISTKYAPVDVPNQTYYFRISLNDGSSILFQYGLR